MKVVQLKVLEDNFIYVLLDEKRREAAVIDPAEAKPVLNFLQSNSLKLKFILNTHHHVDHVGANLELKEFTGCTVVGFKEDAARIPGIDVKLGDGDTFKFNDFTARVLFVPGHTLGHIAFYFEKEKALFCGDTIFSMGCGRLFEGTPAQMFNSFLKLKALPDDTLVYCTHEYTISNARFAAAYFGTAEFNKNLLDLQSLLAAKGTTVPSTLAFEKQWNPFMLAKTAEEFAKARKAKDDFR